VITSIHAVAPNRPLRAHLIINGVSLNYGS
jgi:hypothetical protein